VIGQKRTNEIVLTGDHVDAYEAERIGLVNRVVPRDELDDATAALVARIAPTPGPILELTKRALVQAYEAMGLRPAQATTLDLMTELNALDLPELREFDEIVATDGLKAALAWRSARYT
jgi:enoyl-CoA hydratase